MLVLAVVHRPRCFFERLTKMGSAARVHPRLRLFLGYVRSQRRRWGLAVEVACAMGQQQTCFVAGFRSFCQVAAEKRRADLQNPRGPSWSASLQRTWWGLTRMMLSATEGGSVPV